MAELDPNERVGLNASAPEQGVARMDESLAASRRIAWLNLVAAVVAFTAVVCAMFVHLIH
jgi:hypothetical protein